MDTTIDIGQHALVSEKRLQRRHGREAVDRSEFMSELEAAKALGIDGIVWRVTRGILTPAALDDGTIGVTRSSVEAEREWQRWPAPRATQHNHSWCWARWATRWMRLRRTLGGIVQWF